MRIYELNMGRLLRGLLPPFLRRPGLLALLGAMLSQVYFLHSRFMDIATIRRKKVGLNGQTINLTAQLNELFDPLLAEIYIVNNSVITDGIYLAHSHDPEQSYLGAQTDIAGYLAVATELKPGAASFTVFVPVRLAALLTDPAASGVIDTYKLHGTNYNIITY